LRRKAIEKSFWGKGEKKNVQKKGGKKQRRGGVALGKRGAGKRTLRLRKISRLWNASSIRKKSILLARAERYDEWAPPLSQLAKGGSREKSKMVRQAPDWEEGREGQTERQGKFLLFEMGKKRKLKRAGPLSRKGKKKLTT